MIKPRQLERLKGPIMCIGKDLQIARSLQLKIVMVEKIPGNLFKRQIYAGLPSIGGVSEVKVFQAAEGEQCFR